MTVEIVNLAAAAPRNKAAEADPGPKAAAKTGGGFGAALAQHHSAGADDRGAPHMRHAGNKAAHDQGQSKDEAPTAQAAAATVPAEPSGANKQQPRGGGGARAEITLAATVKTATKAPGDTARAVTSETSSAPRTTTGTPAASKAVVQTAAPDSATRAVLQAAAAQTTARADKQGNAKAGAAKAGAAKAGAAKADAATPGRPAQGHAIATPRAALPAAAGHATTMAGNTRHGPQTGAEASESRRAPAGRAHAPAHATAAAAKAGTAIAAAGETALAAHADTKASAAADDLPGPQIPRPTQTAARALPQGTLTAATAGFQGFSLNAQPPAAQHAVTPAGIASAGAPAFTAQLRATLGSEGWNRALQQQSLRLTRMGGGRAELTLHPPQLGRIQVSLKIGEQTLVHFASPNAQVRATVEAALPQLRQAFAQNGIELGQASVGEQGHQPFDPEHARQPDHAAGAEPAEAEEPAAVTITRITGRTAAGGVDIFA